MEWFICIFFFLFIRIFFYLIFFFLFLFFFSILPLHNMLRIIASFLGLLSINGVYSKAYIAGASKKSYADAQAYCITQGSNLATISSVSDQQDAELACPASISGEGCWFGLNDKGTEGSFSFIDGTPVTYSDFA
eukprot:730366_1